MMSTEQVKSIKDKAEKDLTVESITVELENLIEICREYGRDNRE